ncbi:hypothetical protein [Vibrio sp. WXL103]|uniref:hypothetical protein n=1 Tax=Vibrio sp. WXL103 TaxID=3450710 RepID=UPI003EC890F7
MKTNNIKNSIVAAAVTSIMAGCGGGSGDSDNGGGSGYTQMKSNTKGATAFAFVTESASFSDEVSIDAMSSRNGESSLTTVSGSCDDLVKVVEVEIEDPDSPDPEAPEFITEKVFSRSNSNNCHIHEVVAMKEHLILNGNFHKLADVTGNEIEECLLVALPMDEESGLGECLVYNDNPYGSYRSYINGINVTADGSGLHIMYHHAPDPDNSPLLYLPTLAYWDNNGKVENIHQQPTERHNTPVRAAWSYDGSEHYFVRDFDGNGNFAYPAHANCTSGQCGGMGIDYNFSVGTGGSALLPEKYIQVGEYVVTNLRHSEGISQGSAVVNTKYMAPLALTDFTLDGNSGLLTVLRDHNFQHEDEEYVYFAGDFSGTYPAPSAYNRFFKVAKGDLGTQFIQIEDIFDFSEYREVFQSTVGDTNFIFLVTDTGQKPTLSYYDVNKLEHVSENILERPELAHYDTYEVRQYVSGVKIIASDFYGEADEVFFDQTTGEITKDPIDKQEIGGTIPLYPTSGI